MPPRPWVRVPKSSQIINDYYFDIKETRAPGAIFSAYQMSLECLVSQLFVFVSDVSVCVPVVRVRVWCVCLCPSCLCSCLMCPYVSVCVPVVNVRVWCVCLCLYVLCVSCLIIGILSEHILSISFKCLISLHLSHDWCILIYPAWPLPAVSYVFKVLCFVRFT